MGRRCIGRLRDVLKHPCVWQRERKRTARKGHATINQQHPETSTDEGNACRDAVPTTTLHHRLHRDAKKERLPPTCSALRPISAGWAKMPKLAYDATQPPHQHDATQRHKRALPLFAQSECATDCARERATRNLAYRLNPLVDKARQEVRRNGA